MVPITFIEILLIAISLSMDAFSLSVSLSTLKFDFQNKYIHVLSVGIFHFVMPLIGFTIKNLAQNIIYIPSKPIFICVILFIIIGIIIDSEDTLTNKITNPIIFAFMVSIDSFSIGITLEKSALVISCCLFAVISAMFTFLGFKIGKIINANYNRYSKIIALLILLLVLLSKLI